VRASAIGTVSLFGVRGSCSFQKTLIHSEFHFLHVNSPFGKKRPRHGPVHRMRRGLLASAAAAMAVAAAADEPQYVVGTSDVCRDLEESCGRWAASGECDRNVGYMKLYACRTSCHSCAMDVADLSPVPVVEESFMQSTPRKFGSCSTRVPVERRLRWGASADVAAEIGCFNRAGAEPKGSWERTGLPKAAARKQGGKSTITFYDTISGLPLFVAPRNRSMEQFVEESRAHGWPSFRDAELVLENLRQIRGTHGEIVSAAGMHLGHNLPDGLNRYCINLVSIAGHPPLSAALPGRSRRDTATDGSAGPHGDGRLLDGAAAAADGASDVSPVEVHGRLQQEPTTREEEKELPAHSVEL
jgi:peptide methionine sulfoxide reductase MsrB